MKEVAVILSGCFLAVVAFAPVLSFCQMWHNDHVERAASASAAAVPLTIEQRTQPISHRIPVPAPSSFEDSNECDGHGVDD